jgi:hyperosmotically inducible periplasmic protein
MGIGDELSAMPPVAFRFDSSWAGLRINVTKEDLARAPHFKSNEWPNFSDARYDDSVYHAYGVAPYFNAAPDADNTRRNVRDRESSYLTPADQSTSREDVDITRRIRQQLAAQDGLSVNARNVKVITVNGHVTLRGPVNSEEELRLVVENACRVVPRDQVNNQLEVKKE